MALAARPRTEHTHALRPSVTRSQRAPSSVLCIASTVDMHTLGFMPALKNFATSTCVYIRPRAAAQPPQRPAKKEKSGTQSAERQTWTISLHWEINPGWAPGLRPTGMIVQDGFQDPAGARSAPLEPAAGAEKFGRFYRFVTISKQFLVLRTACNSS